MKPKVFFTKKITPEKVIEMYDALGIDLPGRVAVKVHSGAQVLSVDYTGEGIEVETIVDPILYGRLKDYITKEC